MALVFNVNIGLDLDVLVRYEAMHVALIVDGTDSMPQTVDTEASRSSRLQWTDNHGIADQQLLVEGGCSC